MTAPGTPLPPTTRPGRILDLLGLRGQDRAEADRAEADRVEVDRVEADQDLAHRGQAQHPLDQVKALAERDLAGRGRKDLAGRDLPGRGKDLAGRGKDLPGRGKDLAGRDLPGRGKDQGPGQAKDQDRADRGRGRGLADQDNRLDPPDRVLPVRDKGPGDRRPADPHQAWVRITRLDPSRTRRRALTIGALTKWAARLMRLAASAHSVTARRLLRRQEDSAGMTDLLPAGRRLTGMGRRLQAAGTVLRLRVVGTAAGPDRHATLAAHGATSGRSTMAASPPFRSSIRFSVGGASGSSVFGSRCTDGK